MKTFDVFVYGTLRKGGTNEHYLRNSSCLQKELWISGFCLYDYQQSYPFMLEAGAKERVKGEVYRVSADQFEQLNILEDVENQLYRLVFLEQYQSFTYLKYNSNVEELNKIPGGDWISYIREISQ